MRIESSTNSPAFLGLICLLFLFQGACAHRRIASTQRSLDNTYFLDLQPGRKVRVVTPMLKSGGYVLPSIRKVAGSGTDLAVSAEDGFLGYETAEYNVVPRRDGGVQIRFLQAKVWQDGKTTTRSRSMLPLFLEAGALRYVRLVYLIRESKADHNTAIVAANDPATLEELTWAVTQTAECRTSETAACRWVPAGVAVRPEED